MGDNIPEIEWDEAERRWYAVGFKEAIKADDAMIERVAKDAEARGYLRGISDAQLAIHHPDVLWAHSRAIDALKAKAKE